MAEAPQLYRTVSRDSDDQQHSSIAQGEKVVLGTVNFGGGRRNRRVEANGYIASALDMVGRLANRQGVSTGILALEVVKSGTATLLLDDTEGNPVSFAVMSLARKDNLGTIKVGRTVNVFSVKALQ